MNKMRIFVWSVVSSQLSVISQSVEKLKVKKYFKNAVTNHGAVRHIIKSQQGF